MSLPRLDPRTWTARTRSTVLLAAPGLLGGLAVLLVIPRRLVSPLMWTVPQWVSIGLLFLITTGLVALHGAVAAVRDSQEATADELDRLRAEVAGLREAVHQAEVREAERPTITLQAVSQDAPTTVTGIPSARPRVPGADWAPEKRGKHAAAD